MSGVLGDLLASCDGDSASFHHLSELINKDPALTAKILAVGNSALFRRPQQFTSVERVLITLGLDLVKTIVVAAAVQQFFEQVTHGARFDLRAFWRQALACATTARVLANLTGYAAPGEAYLGGLLSNLGQLILARAHPAEYGAILEVADDGVVPESEASRFGVTHTEIGAAIIEGWALQSHLADAVRYHHEPAPQVLDAPHLVKILVLGNSLAAANVEGREPPYGDADLVFGLTREVTNSLQKDAREQTAEVATALHLDLQEPIVAEGSMADDPLARVAREQALLGAVQQQLRHADDEQSLGEAIFHCTHILFGLEPLVFLCDGERDLLYGLDLPGQDWRVADVNLSCQHANSLLARALRESKALYEPAETESWPVVDRQLARMLDGEGLFCLPLKVEDQRLGVLVFATGAERQSQIAEIEPLLGLFAREAADALLRFRRRQVREERPDVENQAQWKERVRELVHETNNPLGIIRNYLYLLSNRMESDPAAQEDLRVVRDEIERVAGLIRRFNEVEAEEEVKPRAVDINQVVSDTLRLAADTLVHDNAVDIAVDLDQAMPPIVTRHDLLKQVILNLIKNALEAMAQAGGRLEVTTQDYVYWHDRECVEIVISDSGPGIPPDVLANLFKPVASTKGEGHAGLGLSIAKNLMDELGGFISCRSSEAKGTRFQLLLPRDLVAGEEE